ncbi:type II toxin-antitoxin system VapC family toxin [Knoellia sp. CPCC 206453]|uniref:type II toxin-antitoxin system VapC family toxin n=1 Tax=Knoellia pratensis TaxID=3404796 RepID=UPI00362449AF
MAIHEGEPERARFVDVLATSRGSLISAATYVECGIVLDRKRPEQPASRLDDLLDQFDIEVVALTPEQAHVARRAHRRYGRGSGHPAKLNLGDCYSYALAMSEDEPLLFTGEDFTHTDVKDASVG